MSEGQMEGLAIPNPNDVVPPEPPAPSSGNSGTAPAVDTAVGEVGDIDPDGVVDFQKLSPREQKVAQALLSSLHQGGMLLSPEEAKTRRAPAPAPKPEPKAAPRTAKEAEADFFRDIDTEVDTTLKQAKTVDDLAAAIKKGYRDAVGKAFGLADTIASEKAAPLIRAEYERNKTEFFKKHGDLSSVEESIERILAGKEHTIDDILDIKKAAKQAAKAELQQELEAKAQSARARTPSFMEMAQGRGSAPSGETGPAANDKLRTEVLGAMLGESDGDRKKAMARWVSRRH